MGPAGAETRAAPDELLALDEQQLRVIAPTRRRLKLRQLPGQWPIIRVLAARDFKVKYRQSLLGPIWLVFQPLALLVAFLVAFRGLSKIHTSGVPYAVFALVGLSSWAFLQASLTIGTSSIVSNVTFVRSTPCPRSAFPLASIIASLPSFAVPFAAAVVGAVATGHLSPRVALVPFALVWLMVITCGAVALTSSAGVRYRDAINSLPFLLQVGVFLVPVGYSLSGLSPTLRHLVEINPVTGLLEAMRWMVLSGYHPVTAPIFLSLALTVVVAIAGWRVFTAIETTMADEI